MNTIPVSLVICAISAQVFAFPTASQAREVPPAAGAASRVREVALSSDWTSYSVPSTVMLSPATMPPNPVTVSVNVLLPAVAVPSDPEVTRANTAKTSVRTPEATSVVQKEPAPAPAPKFRVKAT